VTNFAISKCQSHACSFLPLGTQFHQQSKERRNKYDQPSRHEDGEQDKRSGTEIGHAGIVSYAWLRVL